MRSMGLFICRR
ncbi:hypothetical protein EBX93_05315 [bacterium]|nr:hypothetical protein [bacterium]